MRYINKIIPQAESILISKCISPFYRYIIVGVAAQKIPVQISVITTDTFTYNLEYITVPPYVEITFSRIKWTECIILVIIFCLGTKNL